MLQHLMQPKPFNQSSSQAASSSARQAARRIGRLTVKLLDKPTVHRVLDLYSWFNNFFFSKHKHTSLGDVDYALKSLVNVYAIYC